jgi:hypothetical protein
MDSNISQPTVPILESAWQHYADLDANAKEIVKRHLSLRRWVAYLGVVATLLAIILDVYGEQLSALVALVLKFLLILTPIVGSIIAAVVNKFYSGGSWLVMRAGAEEIIKEIYIYRTVLQNNSDRRNWLNNRLATIQRQVYKSLGGELVLKKYKGNLPPYYTPGDESSDPGFHDLTGDEYLRFRLEDQLNWHSRRVLRDQPNRTRLQLSILAMGGAGAVLAALGGEFTLWVALTASIAAAMSGWQELRNLDGTIKNYSKVILELNILRDYWLNLEPEERSKRAYYRLVRSAEEVLWGQHIEYIKNMQDALDTSREDEAKLVEEMVRISQELDATYQQRRQEEILGYAREELEASFERTAETYTEALGTFAEEAASEEVAREVQALRQAAASTARRVRSSLDGITHKIAEEFTGVELNKSTPKETINAVLSQFPPQGEGRG